MAKQQICYIDVGGTFTDCLIVDDKGDFVLQKSSSTPNDISVGFFNSIERTVRELKLPLDEVLRQLEVLGFGATVVVNALLTRTGRKCGLITTKGFEDIFEIGRGKAARVYRIDGAPPFLTRKEFSPICHVRLWNWFFYNSPHLLTTETGYKYAYWKRRIAHRLCEYLDCGVHIPDALELSPDGFKLRYVEGRPPSMGDRQALRTAIRKLEDFFDSIGMPTWSFSRRNPFSNSNFILKDKIVYVIDYEQSVPVPDSRGNIGYDIIYFEDVHKFITDNRKCILDKLGENQTQHLTEAFESAKEYHSKLDVRPKMITKIFNANGSKKEVCHG